VKSENIPALSGADAGFQHQFRRLMLRKAQFALAFFAAAIFSAAPLYSQSPSLIAAAKKDGKVVVYGSLESDVADAALKASRIRSALT
jgi:hypothetical protein